MVEDKDNFKDKINGVIEDADNDIDIADMMKREHDKEFMEDHFGRPPFPNDDDNGNDNNDPFKFGGNGGNKPKPKSKHIQKK